MRTLFWVALTALILAVFVPGCMAAHASATCQTSTGSNPYGSCSYPPYSVSNDQWGTADGTEVITATSAAHWSVKATGVTQGYAYPDVRLSGVPAESSFHIGMPGGTGYSAEAAYDVCAGNCSGDEMMIWVYNIRQSPWAGETKVTTLGGWTLYRHSSDKYLWKPTKNVQVASATVPLAQMVKDTGMKGVNTTEFGWEIHLASDDTFSMLDFTTS
jgi:hypothetical protein